MFQKTLSIPFWWPLLLAAGYLCYGLGSYGLLDNNEGLYAEIAREMSRGSSLVIPHVNGLVYMEKPPLLYYLVALSLRLFGEAEKAARIVPLLASLACMAGVWWYGARIRRPEAGKLAVMLLCSSLGYMLMSRVVMFDMLFTAFFSFSLFGFHVAWREGNRGVLRLAYAALALALLTKGFLAVALFGLVVTGYFLVGERGRVGQGLAFALDWPGVLLFFLIATPWHALASLEHPRFAWFYFVNEHVLRFIGRRVPHDYYSGPVWYYLPRILLFLLPWTFHFLLCLARTGEESDRGPRRFLWAACLLPLAFFSASSAKANYYMVVALPALALVLALHVESLVAAGRARLLAWPAGVIVLLALAGAGFLVARPGLLGTGSDAGLRVAMLGLLLLLGGLSLILAWTGRASAALMVSGLLLAPLQVCLIQEVVVREPFLSARPLARAIHERCPDCSVLLYRDFENLSALPYYLEQAPHVIDSVSNDLWFAEQEDKAGRRPDSKFVSSSEVLSRFRGQRLAVVVLQEHLVEFLAGPLAGDFRLADKLGRASLYLN